VIAAVFLAFMIRTYLIEAYRIPNSLMKPTLQPGDILFVNKWTQTQKQEIQPKRGDIVVFTKSIGNTPPASDYIRRVVGLPGDKIAIKNGHLHLNGSNIQIIEPDSLKSPCFREKISEQVEYPICLEGATIPDFAPETVPEDSVFVLEDNRNLNQPRKAWGNIPLSSLKGKALWIWLSFEDPPAHSNSENTRGWLPQFFLDRMFRRI
jgi:signal peptidase I